jgi:uracil-DNA glycosylase
MYYTLTLFRDGDQVVVIGQDPYHGPNQAHGLAFSVMKPERPPPSLKNIFKEAKNCIPGFAVPSHGDLSGWSRQGVFLLNTCLTVQQGNANSHQKKGWEEFVTAVIKAIDQREDKIVFLLWGKPANERCAHINRRKHTVISSSHPSPLGATKTATPFIGSKCFLKCNDALVAAGKTPIDWNL